MRCIIASMVALVMLGGCSSSDEPSDEGTLTATPTASPTASATASPSPAATEASVAPTAVAATPSSTATVALTATVVATPTAASPRPTATPAVVAPTATAVAATATPAPPTATIATPAATPPPVPAAVQVVMQGFGYQPQSIEIDAGATVTWVNRDAVQHDADGPDGLWDGPLINEGETTSRSFNTPGKFLVTCSIHPFMQSLITVR